MLGNNALNTARSYVTITIKRKTSILDTETCKVLSCLENNALNIQWRIENLDNRKVFITWSRRSGNSSYTVRSSSNQRGTEVFRIVKKILITSCSLSSFIIKKKYSTELLIVAIVLAGQLFLRIPLLVGLQRLVHSETLMCVHVFDNNNLH